MVDQQGGRIWYGECPDLLGPDGGWCTTFSDWGFVFVDDFCWALNFYLALLGGDWLPFELEEDCNWLFQHLVGLHGDTQPTVGADGPS